MRESRFARLHQPSQDGEGRLPGWLVEVAGFPSLLALHWLHCIEDHQSIRRAALNWLCLL